MTSSEAEAIRQRIRDAGRAGLDHSDMRHTAQAQAATTTEIAMLPSIRSPRCLICNSGPDVVAFVNRLVVSGATYTSVHKALDAINEARSQLGQPEIGYQAVIRHAKRHLPFKSAAVREIYERRARAAQLDFAEGVANIITVAGYAEAMMVRAAQEMSDVTVSPAEGLKAAQFLNDLMREEKGSAGIESAFAELHYLIQAIKEVVPAEYHQRILDRIDERRGSQVIDATVEDEFDPGVDEVDFDPPDDHGDEDF